MALRKIAGPYIHRDLFGNPKNTTMILWCNELDGFLSYGHWWSDPTGADGYVGMGVLQLDGTFTPRVDMQLSGLPLSGHQTHYDLKRRRLAYHNSEGTNDWFEMGVDWFTLKAPYNPVTILRPNGYTGTHQVDTFTCMFLPDRMLFVGYKIEGEFFTGVYEVSIFSLEYGSTGPLVLEHLIRTEVVPGSGIWEEWKGAQRFMQSSTPERTVFLRRFDAEECKVLEYDYIAKKVVGWVRRLGVHPELNGPPVIEGYSVKHKLWAVRDYVEIGEDTYWRLSLFADEAVPFALSNPIALTPTRAGEAVRYRVRLTGEDGDPCIGHRINWTCSALGTVLSPQTLTNELGYAETTVAYPPRFEGPWEGTTISAEVIF